jgi:sugar lactone lactonase YvrE
VVAVYHFDQTVAPQGTYLNDIRFTPDSRSAVITNSGQPGSLVVLDVASGQARRVLDGHPSTQYQQDVVIKVNGKQLRMLDGQPAHFSADGIIVDQAGQYAYWQATTGNTMYRAPLSALFDPNLTPAQQGAAVETVAKTFVADGYWLARNGGFT